MNILDVYLVPLTDREIEERTAIVRAAKAAKGRRGRLTQDELTAILGPSMEDDLDRFIEENPETRKLDYIRTLPPVPGLYEDFSLAARRWRTRRQVPRTKQNGQADIRQERDGDPREPGSGPEGI